MEQPGGKRDADDVEEEGPDEVDDDPTISRHGEMNGDGHVLQARMHQHNVRSLDRDVCAASDRDPQISLSERRRVVDPVSYHGDHMALRLQRLHARNLVGWERLCLHVADADASCSMHGCVRVVACDQPDLHLLLRQPVDDILSLGLNGIGQSQAPYNHALDGDEDDGTALRLPFGNDLVGPISCPSPFDVFGPHSTNIVHEGSISDAHVDVPHLALESTTSDGLKVCCSSILGTADLPHQRLLLPPAALQHRPSLLMDRLPQWMFRVCFCTLQQAPHHCADRLLPRALSSDTPVPCDLRFALSYSTCLVKDDRTDAMSRLQRSPSLNQDPFPRSHSSAHHDGRRSRQSERTGACDNQHRHGKDERKDGRMEQVAFIFGLSEPVGHEQDPSHPCQECDDYDNLDEDSGDDVGDPLDLSLGGLRLLDEVDDLCEDRRIASLFNSHVDEPVQVDGAADHLRSGLLVNRERLACDHALVH
mmetsp:Transcript_23816/g.77585  ORF Transcript_23816/g.77585 Transcript_23816/m.77585 type:complete len:477 (+) Transcript_23816:1197-2627(+)